MTKKSPLDDVKAANSAAIASATATARKSGIPYFEADSRFVYAVYPDGQRIVVEKVKRAASPTDEKTA
jgi:hypothetical protein